MTGRLRRTRPGARAGYTLIELILAMSAYTVIIGIVVLAVQLMCRALPGARTEHAASTAVSTTLDLADELRYAVSFSRSDPHAVEFTLLDRNGDGVDEKLLYEWSATPGAPLLRTLNGQAPVTVADDVHEFTLAYELGTGAPSPLDEELAVIRHHSDAPGGHFHDHKLESNKWCGQYFLPDLPEGVTEWKLKGIRFMAKREGDEHDGIIEVWVTGADAMHAPTDEILDYAVVAESDLDESYTWVDVDFTALNTLDANHGFCIVLAQVSPGGSAGKIPYNHAGDVLTGGTHWITSGDAGASWSDPVDDKDMRFFVFGTYDGYEPTAQQFVASVALELRAGLEATSSARSTIRLMNAPGVTP